jgi:undecaprenyl diphosphate synthase
MGHLADLPEDPLQGLLEGVEKTSRNTGLNLNLALSYGGRAEFWMPPVLLFRTFKMEK